MTSTAPTTSSGTRGSPSLSEPQLARHSTTKLDRKSTRLNSSHSQISYAVFCLKKKEHHSYGFVTSVESLRSVRTVPYAGLCCRTQRLCGHSVSHSGLVGRHLVHTAATSQIII